MLLALQRVLVGTRHVDLSSVRGYQWLGIETSRLVECSI